MRPRTAIVAVVLAVALVLTVSIATGGADPVPSLPVVTPERLVASALEALAERTPVSGTVQTHVDLGLPELPSSLGGPSGILSLLLADQTFQYWRSPAGSRVAQIVPFGERDAIATPSDLWLWDSDSFAAWHASVPAGASATAPPSLGDLETIVGRVLHAIAPYASVDEGTPERVAGRDAYVLVLTPTDPATLVGEIRLAIDAETRVPLSLEIVPKGTLDPAVRAGFTDVSFAAVDPSIFAFSPPEGATVHELPDLAGALATRPSMGSSPGDGTPPEVRTFGEGFGLIVAVRIRADDIPAEVRSLLPYAGPLGSVELVGRGADAWILAGAVRLDRLHEVESELP